MSRISSSARRPAIPRLRPWHSVARCCSAIGALVGRAARRRRRAARPARARGRRSGGAAGGEPCRVCGSLARRLVGGLAAVPVNARLHPQELAFILRDAGARLGLVSPELAPAVGALAATLRGARAGDRAGLRRVSPAAGERPAAARARGPGQHGLAVLHLGHDRPAQGRDAQHRNLLAMTLNYYRRRRPAAGRRARWLHAAPISHGSGLWNLLDGGARRRCRCFRRAATTRCRRRSR